MVELAYEAYAEMAEPILATIGAEIEGAMARHPRWRWSTAPGSSPSGSHRWSSPWAHTHRPEAYAASRYALEALKDRLPVWKKEQYEDGSAWKANAPGPTTR